MIRSSKDQRTPRVCSITRNPTRPATHMENSLRGKVLLRIRLHRRIDTSADLIPAGPPEVILIYNGGVHKAMFLAALKITGILLYGVTIAFILPEFMSGEYPDWYAPAGKFETLDCAHRGGESAPNIREQLSLSVRSRCSSWLTMGLPLFATFTCFCQCLLASLGRRLRIMPEIFRPRLGCSSRPWRSQLDL